MSNLQISELTSIDSTDLARVNGGAEQGPWESGLSRIGQGLGGVGGAMLGTPGSPVTQGLLGVAGSELGYQAGAQLGRAIDNPQPGPGGGVNGGNGPEQVSP